MPATTVCMSDIIIKRWFYAAVLCCIAQSVREDVAGT